MLRIIACLRACEGVPTRFLYRGKMVDLETSCDPSGYLQTIADLTEHRDALYKLIEELRKSWK